MTVLPIVAALVALAFAVHLFVRSGRRRTWHEAVWGLAMLMFALASGALALGVLDGWSTGEFRVYWLFGAVLNVPYLALGEAYLLVRQRWAAHALLALLLAATAWASAEVRTAPLHSDVLRTEEFFAGREVLGEDAPARTLAFVYSYTGTAVLVLGILWSALSMRGRPELRGRFWGTLLIAAGALVVAGGSAFAAAGSFAGFSVTLAVGVAVMYWGFLTATAPRARIPAEGPGRR
jgi:MFS family permease